MTEEIKELIEKIQQEGVSAGEHKAGQIVEEAKSAARRILVDAKAQAQMLIDEAHEKALKARQSSEASLKQAGRDALLSLRAEINAMLNMIVVSGVREALAPAEIARFVETLIRKLVEGSKEAVVAVSANDFKGMEKGFLVKLQAEVKKGITLRPSEEIHGGFTISFDSGKSCYDFTDKALASYISAYLEPKLAELLFTETPPEKK